MNEQAQKSLAELIKYATSGVDAMVAFGQEQLPILVEQLLMWHAIKSGIFFLIGLLFIAIGIMTVPIANRLLRRMEIKLDMKKAKARDDYSKREPWTLFGNYGSSTSMEYDRLMRKTFEGGEIRGAGLAAAVCCIVMGLIVAGSNLDWLQILIAPKLYLFEYGASLVK